MTQPWILSGTVAGEDQSALILNAKLVGSSYFGDPTPCINVILTDATAEVENMIGDGKIVAMNPTFTANFTAEVKHDWSSPMYGFARCVNCDTRKPNA